MTAYRSDKIYLDHAATTPLDTEVFRKMTPYFTDVFGNASSQHCFGREAANALTCARDEVARAVGVASKEIYFTSGGTEADNLGIKGISLANADRGKHIIVSAIEHPAVLESAFSLKKFGYEITLVMPDGDGVIRPESVEKALRPDTVLVAVMSANNETGAIQPIREIYERVHAAGAYLWCDCVQSAGALPFGLFPADGWAISAHKFNGPKGVGVARIRSGVRFEPQMCGGHQERGLRGGTINTPAIVGLAEALKMSQNNSEKVNAYVSSLRDSFESCVLKLCEGVRINGANARRLPSHSDMSIGGCDGQNVVMLLDMQGVAASTGAACSSGATTPSHVLSAMGLSEDLVRGGVRFSFGRENTPQEAERAAHILAQVVSSIRKSL